MRVLEPKVRQGTGYMTLQQAVDNVPKDGYIVVKQDGKATVRNIITFTVKKKQAWPLSLPAVVTG